MFQEATTWDLRSVNPPVPPGFGLYLLFLLVAFLTSIAKLVRVWRPAPPFRLERQEKNSAYVQMLEVVSRSLRQWTTCTFLAWGILACHGLYEICNGLLSEKAVGHFVIIFVIKGFLMTLNMALLTALVLVLIRWHILRRIEWLRQTN